MKIVVVFLALCGLVSVLAQSSINHVTEGERETYMDPDDMFKLYWSYNSDYIIIKLEVKTTGWVGIGFSANGDMKGADIHVGWVKDGRAYLTDRHGPSHGNGFPPMDSEQNVELLEGFECDGITVIKFKRQLAGCQDGQDRKLTTDTLRVIYAFGGSDPRGDELATEDYHFLNRGTQSLIMFQVLPEETFLESEVFSFDMTTDGSRIPSQRTYYDCRILELPQLSKKHHVIKMEPIINETYIRNIHHFTVSLCQTTLEDPNVVGRSFECYKPGNRDLNRCFTIIGAWAVGGGSTIFPDNVGLPLGETGQSRYVKLEIHYDNPHLIDIVNDRSGMRFIFTPNLRQYDAGIMDIGVFVSAFNLIVPPNADRFKIYGGCDAACIGGAMTRAGVESIRILNVFLHSHLTGRELTLRHIRNGTELPYIAKDDHYDFNFQLPRVVNPGREVRKGDSLQTVCSYTSKGKSHPVVGGLDTTKEMCISFFMYYPRVPMTICNSGPQAAQILAAKLGVTGSRRINQRKSWSRTDLNDIIVTSPESMANRSLDSIISEAKWSEKELLQLSEEFRLSNRYQGCFGYRSSSEEFTLRGPLVVNQSYVEPQRNNECIAPSSGFVNNKKSQSCY